MMIRRSRFKSGDIKIHIGTLSSIPRGWSIHPDFVGRAIVGASDDSDNMTQFGSSEQSLTVDNHTLSISQIPSHNHNSGFYLYNSDENNSRPNYKKLATSSSKLKTESTGGGSGHNHSGVVTVEQPSIKVFVIVKE